MKKALSVLLAAILILSLFSLVACSNEAATKAPTAAPAAAPSTAAPAAAPATEAVDLTKTKPCEYVQEKLDAGMEVIVGCSMIEDVPILMEQWAGEIKAKLEPEGVTFVISAADGDMGLMISQIENYTTMGAACVIAVPTDVLTIQDVAKASMEKGTQIVTWGVQPCDFTVAVRNDVVGKGRMEGEMAADWSKMRYPGATAENPVKVAHLRDGEITDKVAMDDAMAEAVEKPGTNKVVFVANGVEGTLDGAMVAAQNALTYDPGIRVFITHLYTVAVGANNYVLSQPELDPSEFAAFGADQDAVCVDMIDNLSPKNASILRGCSITTDSPGVRLGDAVLRVLFEGVKAPQLYYAEVFKHTDGTF